VKQIEARLTRELLYLEREISLHDGTVRRLEVALGAAKLSIELSADDGKGGLLNVRLLYGKVVSFEAVAPEDYCRCGPMVGFGHLGYCEVDIVDDAFEHRFLFSTGIEFRIVFGEFRLEVLDVE